jgi:hypothetical protein
MNDLHQSLDTTIAAIRAEHAAEMQACRDRTLAAEVRAELLQSHVTEARQLAAERLAVKLVTQFSVVEKVFAEAKALAEAVYAEESEATPTTVPANRFADLQEQLEAKTEAMK